MLHVHLDSTDKEGWCATTAGGLSRLAVALLTPTVCCVPCRTAFHYACAKGEPNIAHALIMQGCKTDIRDPRGITARDCARLSGRMLCLEKIDGLAVLDAVHHADGEKINQLLDAGVVGVNVQADNGRTTPLRVATSSSSNNNADVRPASSKLAVLLPVPASIPADVQARSLTCRPPSI